MPKRVVLNFENLDLFRNSYFGFHDADIKKLKR